MPVDHEIEINGVVRPFVATSLDVEWDLDGRGSIAFDVPSGDASFIPAERQTVLVRENGVPIARGTIDTPRSAGVGGVGLTPVETHVTALDAVAIFDRLYVTGTMPAGSLKTKLQWLVSFFSGHGLELDPAQVDGPLDLPEMPYPEPTRGADIAGDLEMVTGYALDVSPTLAVRMFLPGTDPAPFAIVEGDGNVYGDLEVERVDLDYGNRIRLRYTFAALAAYAFYGGGGNVVDGDQVTIGSRTYTFHDELQGSSGSVLIGPDLHESLSHLMLAIASADRVGAGVLYSAATAVHTQVSAYFQHATALRVVALTPGSAGNNIGVDSTSGGAGWFTEGGGPTSTLLFGLDAGLGNEVVVDDAVEQAKPGVGVWEALVVREDVYTADVAQLFAAAYLARAVQSSYSRVTYATRRPGLRKGQTQTIEAPARGATGTHLITNVRVRRPKPFRPVWYVTAISGTVWPRTSWKDTYAGWSAGGGSNAAAPPGGVTVVTGGDVASVFHGGSREMAVPMGAPPAWTPIVGWLPHVARATGTRRIRAALGARAAGVAVKVRWHNLTDGTDVESSWVTAVTPQVLIETEFLVTEEAGKRYRLDVITDTNGVSAYALVQSERV